MAKKELLRSKDRERETRKRCRDWEKPCPGVQTSLWGTGPATCHL